jgi:DNA-binding MarR family transcriptional regulator
MEDKTEVIIDLISKFYKMINLVNSLEREAYDFDVGETLHPSEIHTIQAIGNNSGCNITALARELGITKAAASQMVTKLKRRGFVRKVKSVDNNKEILLILTMKGRTAFDGHERFHADMYKDFIQYLNKVPSEQIEMFEEILDKVSFYVDRYRNKQLTSAVVTSTPI